MTTNKEPPQWLSTPLGLFLTIEFIALLIGVAAPLTPSKTGGDGDLAKYIIEEPTYLEKVFVAFLATNLLIATIALAVFVYWRFGGGESSDG